MGNPSAVFAFAKAAKILNTTIIGKERVASPFKYCQWKLSIYRTIKGEVTLPAFIKAKKVPGLLLPDLIIFWAKESVNLQIIALEPKRNIVDYRGKAAAKRKS